MTYFRELPNLEYQSPLLDRKSSDQYIEVKNLFRRVKLRDDLQNIFTIFEKYQIPDGSRPELVAEEFYGSSQYDWVVLISANITNIKDQWPLSDADIYKYSDQKYGNNLTEIHHWETTEVKDSKGRLILPEGKIVDSNFTIQNPELPTQSLNPVTAVTNYEYEVKKNNEKRGIYLIKKIYLQRVLMDTRKEMLYGESSEYVNEKLIKTENTRVSMP